MRLTLGLPRAAVGVAIALAVLGGACGALPSSALAWANGPQYGEGFGTHDWILFQANEDAVAAGYDWVDWKTAQFACDDPDMVLRDFYHHVYDTAGDTYGDAPDRIGELYPQAVGELRRGDRIAASRTVGLLSHYLSDVANPLHTDQTPAEKDMHSRYEDAVDDQLESPADGAAILSARTLTPTGDARGLAAQTAAGAHADYEALVAEYVASGNSAQVQAISSRSLNAGVGAVTDVIAGVSIDAGVKRGAVKGGSSAGAAAAGAGTTAPDKAKPSWPLSVWCCLGIGVGLVAMALVALVLTLRRRRD